MAAYQVRAAPSPTEKRGVVLTVSGVFFFGGGVSLFVLRWTQRPSAPQTPARSPRLPIAAPALELGFLSSSLPSRSAFQPLSSASFIPFPILGGDMFFFSISCSLSWDGGSSLQPSEVSLGFFFF